MAKAPSLFADFYDKEVEAQWDEITNPKPDPLAPARKKMVRLIDAGIASVEADPTKSKRNLFEIKEGIAATEIKIDGKVIETGAPKVKVDKLKALLESIKEAVEAGKLDGALPMIEGGSATGRSSSWTPERRAAQAEAQKRAWEERRKKKK